MNIPAWLLMTPEEREFVYSERIKGIRRKANNAGKLVYSNPLIYAESLSDAEAHELRACADKIVEVANRTPDHYAIAKNFGLEAAAIAVDVLSLSFSGSPVGGSIRSRKLLPYVTD